MAHLHPDRKIIGSAFGAKAHSYREHAVVQDILLQNLADLLIGQGAPDGPSVDVGAGIGAWESILHARGIVVPAVCVDISRTALEFNRTRCSTQNMQVQGDALQLPLADSCCRFAVCASVLQWVGDPLAALEQIHRVLAPGGLFLYGIFMEGSLCELREIRQLFGIAEPVRFFEHHVWERILQDAGFVPVASRPLQQQLAYPSAVDALRSLSALGATAVGGSRLSRTRVREFCAEYDRRFRSTEGVTLKYVMLAGLARKAEADA